VRNVRLLSGPLIDLQADAIELFAHDRRESGENLPQLVERLRARLGSDAVHGLACVPSTGQRPHGAKSGRNHPAQEAAHIVPIPEGAIDRIRGLHRGQSACGRPVAAHQRAVPVDRLVSKKAPGRIRLVGQSTSRDYTRAQSAGTSCGVPQSSVRPGRGWFLHGWLHDSRSPALRVATPGERIAVYAELIAYPTSVSCAVPRARKNWSNARRDSGMPRSRSPMNARWPAWCERTSLPANTASSSSSARSFASTTACVACCSGGTVRGTVVSAG
jgi:hypothetical protein